MRFRARGWASGLGAVGLGGLTRFRGLGFRGLGV